jgi:hypothetical protein
VLRVMVISYLTCATQLAGLQDALQQAALRVGGSLPK